MKTYRNISEVEQTVDGVGIVLPGATCQIEDETFNNPNFVQVSASDTRRRSYNSPSTDESE